MANGNVIKQQVKVLKGMLSTARDRALNKVTTEFRQKANKALADWKKKNSPQSCVQKFWKPEDSDRGCSVSVYKEDFSVSVYLKEEKNQGPVGQIREKMENLRNEQTATKNRIRKAESDILSEIDITSENALLQDEVLDQKWIDGVTKKIRGL